MNIRFDQYLLLACDLIKIKMVKMVSPYDRSFHALYLTCALYLSDLEMHPVSIYVLHGLYVRSRLKNDKAGSCF